MSRVGSQQSAGASRRECAGARLVAWRCGLCFNGNKRRLLAPVMRGARWGRAQSEASKSHSASIFQGNDSPKANQLR